MSHLIGRQPIFDRQNEVRAYELLFRPEPGESFPFDDQIATAQVLNNALMNEELSTLVGRAKAFINFPAAFFMQEDVTPPFGPRQLVIEVLERVPVTPTVVNNLKALKDQGYTLALDDFVFKREFIPFLELADLIKLDVLNLAPEKVPLLADKIRQITPAELLAEKVETHDMHQVCLDAGFHYFQGYFYAKPEVIETKEISVSQQALLQLLARLNDPNIQLEEIEEIITQDPGLTVKLFKLAKSFSLDGKTEYTSLIDVLQFYGIQRVRSWATILSLSSLKNTHPDVVRLALIRALFFEKLAKKKGLPQPDEYYLAGLFSNLDALLGLALPLALEPLPLPEQIKQGIIEHSGTVGQFLSWSEKIERNAAHDLPPVIGKLYEEALREANALIGHAF